MTGKLQRILWVTAFACGAAPVAMAQDTDAAAQRQDQAAQAQPPEGRTEAAAARGMKLTELNRSEVRRLQLALREHGFYQGEIDGIVGPQTYGALGAFQRSQDMPVTGRLDLRTANALEYGPVETEIQPVRGGGPEEQQVEEPATPEKSEGEEETVEEVMERNDAPGDKVFNKVRDWTNTNVPKDQR
jgi:peptidoglycan hydrolase-like protein with peptidoglycan-binding domain